MATFRKLQRRFVVFVEVAELEMIEARGTDLAMDLVKDQIRDFYREGFELGLHLHPHWYKAQYENERWLLDYSEYNLCTLPRERIVRIVDRSIAYFRKVLGAAHFTPFSFRAGNWLFQPTRTVASVLAERGIKVDSSVFKGGLRHEHKLDYRRALKNGYYWRFTDNVDVPDLRGALLELPIHTQMEPFWKMLSSKRVNAQHIGIAPRQSGMKNLYRLLDFLRFWHPLKLDFSCMTITELTRMVNAVIQEDQQDPTSFRPIVTIGHTKELVDFETVESFLAFLEGKGIAISTFEGVYKRCLNCT